MNAESVTAYDKLFTLQNNRPGAYCNQGYAYMKLNKSDLAIISDDKCTAL